MLMPKNVLLWSATNTKTYSSLLYYPLSLQDRLYNIISVFVRLITKQFFLPSGCHVLQCEQLYTSAGGSEHSQFQMTDSIQ